MRFPIIALTAFISGALPWKLARAAEIAVRLDRCQSTLTDTVRKKLELGFQQFLQTYLEENVKTLPEHLNSALKITATLTYLGDDGNFFKSKYRASVNVHIDSGNTPVSGDFEGIKISSVGIPKQKASNVGLTALGEFLATQVPSSFQKALGLCEMGGCRLKPKPKSSRY